MSERLPSLKALRTFEAAARHLSFAKAARELAVTPAAVGFQIKQLEDDLGGALFLRKHRSVELTPRGLQLSTELGPAFKDIENAWKAAQSPLERSRLKVTGPTRALQDWILPSVSRAREKLNLQFSWDMTKEMRTLATGQADLAIRWAREPTADLHWEPLLRTWFTPLLRPDVARYVEQPRDLRESDLIGVDYRIDEGEEETMWSAWHRLNNLEAPSKFALTCADTASAVEAAMSTGYVALAGSFLAIEHLENGRLVAPFDTAVAPFSRFWLVCRKGTANTDSYRWFLDAARERAERINDFAKGLRVYHPDGSDAALL